MKRIILTLLLSLPAIAQSLIASDGPACTCSPSTTRTPTEDELKDARSRLDSLGQLYGDDLSYLESGFACIQTSVLANSGRDPFEAFPKETQDIVNSANPVHLMALIFRNGLFSQFSAHCDILDILAYQQWVREQEAVPRAANNTDGPCGIALLPMGGHDKLRKVFQKIGGKKKIARLMHTSGSLLTAVQ